MKNKKFNISDTSQMEMINGPNAYSKMCMFGLGGNYGAEHNFFSLFIKQSVDDTLFYDIVNNIFVIYCKYSKNTYVYCLEEGVTYIAK